MGKFECKKCVYSTNNLGDYKRHILTNKHQKQVAMSSNNIMDTIGLNRTEKDTIGLNRTDTHISTSLGIKDNIINRNYNIDNITNNPNNNIIDNETSNQQYKFTNRLFIIKDNISYCKFCNIKLNSIDKIKRHCINSCISIPSDIKNYLINKYNNDKRTKLSNKKQCISMNNKIIGNTISKSNNNNTTTNNIQNNFTINVLGKESISHISEDRIQEILGSGKYIMKEYLTDIYKDNNNINSLIDPRNKMIIFINENNELESGNMEDYLETITDIHFSNICDMYKENKGICKESTKDSFKKIFSGYYNVEYVDSDDEDDTIDNSYVNPYRKINISRLMEQQLMFKLIDVKYIAKDKQNKFKKFKISNQDNILMSIVNL